MKKIKIDSLRISYLNNRGFSRPFILKYNSGWYFEKLTRSNMLKITFNSCSLFCRLRRIFSINLSSSSSELLLSAHDERLLVCWSLGLLIFELLASFNSFDRCDRLWDSFLDEFFEESLRSSLSLFFNELEESRFLSLELSRDLLWRLFSLSWVWFLRFGSADLEIESLWCLSLLCDLI